jgi:hypothetical protein
MDGGVRRSSIHVRNGSRGEVQQCHMPTSHMQVFGLYLGTLFGPKIFLQSTPSISK